MGKTKASERQSKTTKIKSQTTNRTLQTVNLNNINKKWKSQRPILENNQRVGNHIREKPVNPKNWSKFKFLKPWTPKGLLGIIAFLEQAPGGTLRGSTLPGPSTIKTQKPINLWYIKYKPS